MVHMGEGSKSRKTVEYYDINKNKWHLLKAVTNGLHKYHPRMWIEKASILHTASTWCNMFERMDLRENSKKWKAYVGKECELKFGDVFGAFMCVIIVHDLYKSVIVRFILFSRGSLEMIDCDCTSP